MHTIFLIYVFSLSLLLGLSSADVTVYNTAGQVPLQTATPGGTPPYTGFQAYNPIQLVPPPVPSPAPPSTFQIQLQNGVSTTGLSIPHRGSFFGFSIEFSVVSQISECSTTLFSLQNAEIYHPVGMNGQVVFVH
jgi:hypothetical protein